MKTVDDALAFADRAYSKASDAGVLAAEVRRLQAENERLRADSARIDWLADVNNNVGSVVLPRHIVEQNISSLRQAIDAARSEK